ncbi:MAG: hypothetical protein ACK2U9_06945, partial [Anaerolineae bacterium]
FGLLVGVSQTLAAMALAALWLGLSRWRAGRRQRGEARAAARPSSDAGNLLLAILLLWGYIVLMQFVTVWMANLPEEIRWFVPRLKTDWRWLGLVAAVLLPGLGLVLLLSRRVKTSAPALTFAACVLLLAQALYALWLTWPTLRPAGPQFTLLDLAVLAGAAALWLAAFLSLLALNRSARRTAVAKRALPAPPAAGRRALPAMAAGAASGGGTALVPTESPRRAVIVAGKRTPEAARGGGDGSEESGEREQEPGSIRAGPVVKTLVGVVGVLILATVVLLPWRREEPAEPDRRLPPAAPRLLPQPITNLADYQAKQRQQLQSWGWVDRDHGIARIPVDRAIEILATRQPSSIKSREVQQ